jgi:hypothetical protein
VNTLRRRQLEVVPIPIALRKVFRRALTPLVQQWRMHRAQQRQPYATARDVPWKMPATIASHLQPPQLEHLRTWAGILLRIACHTCEGKLPVLGLGWIVPQHGYKPPGFDGVRYDAPAIEETERGDWLDAYLPSTAVPRARWLWCMIQQPHTPYDWQRDFRSGYRWSERSQSWNLRLDEAPGADPKVPWELGRLQLLPLLALALYCAPSDLRPAILRTVESTLLDFAAQNPPGYGIQWAQGMEAALRIAAIAVTLDLAAPHGLDERVGEAMLLSLYDHACFVLGHLEWSEGMRGNHYLACIAGLSVAAAYFPACRWTAQLRRWCAEQLRREARYQFLPDGGNFEASIAYHRFSAEMLGWATWFLNRTPEGHNILGRDREFWLLLERITTFTEQTTYRSGVAPQIGDNDSGRFVSFLPLADDAESYGTWHADPHPYLSQRNHRETCALLRAVCRNEEHILDALLDDQTQHRQASFYAHTFGVAVLRNAEAEVFLRAGSIGQRGKGGHAHNDQLSITLALDGQEVIADPGTGIYLAQPAMRNRFRSTRMHSTLALDSVEQETWCEGGGEALFWLTSDRAHARIVAATERLIIAEHTAWHLPHRRVVRLEDGTLVIEDFFAAPSEATIWFHLHPHVRADRTGEGVRLEMPQAHAILTASGGATIMLEESLYSHSYGVWTPTRAIAIQPSGTRTQVTIRWQLRS